MTSEIEQAEAEVQQALEHLRQKLTRYKQIARKPPLFLHDKPAPTLRSDAFGQGRIYAGRHQMMAALARGDTGAEVGVQAGVFSRFLLDDIQPKVLHLFDMSDKWLRDDVRNDPRTTLHLGDSSTQLGKQPDASFDWIYIDGDHSYQGVMKDAKQALLKIKPGGLLVFNDYTLWSPGEAMSYGVMACVNGLVNDGLDVLGVALTETGYFDIALKAPA